MGDVFIVLFNCACVLICTGYAVKFAIERVRQETITLWITFMYMVKYIDSKDGPNAFVDFINKLNKEAKNEKNN